MTESASENQANTPRPDLRAHSRKPPGGPSSRGHQLRQLKNHPPTGGGSTWSPHRRKRARKENVPTLLLRLNATQAPWTPRRRVADTRSQKRPWVAHPCGFARVGLPFASLLFQFLSSHSIAHKLFARMHSELYPFVFFSLQSHSNK